MKVFTGKVVSTKMDKTVVVRVERFWLHPIYKKRIRRTTKLKADCQNFNVKVGDMVKIASTRPLSKEKHFKVLTKLKQR